LPDEAAGYEMPEGADAEMFGAMTTVAHEAGLSRKQMEVLSGAQVKIQQEAINKMVGERNEGLDQLRGEWGLSYDEKTQRAGELIKAMGGHPGLEEAIASGNVDAATLRLFDKFATQMGQEGSEITRQINQISQSTPAELIVRRDEITQRMLNEKLSPTQLDQMQKKLVSLSERILATG